MSIARKILSNTAWQIGGKVAMAMLGFLVVKIATNYLSVEGYGEYILIYEFLAFFGIASDLGLFTIAVKEMSKDESKIPKIIGNVLSLRTILVVATMILAIVAAFLIPKYANGHIPLGVAIASFTVFFTILNGTITSVLQVKLQMHYATIAQIVGKIVAVGLMAYIVFFGFPESTDTGFYLLIVAGIVGNAAMFFTTNYYVRKITPLRYQFDLQLWKDVLFKSLPYGLALILNAVYFRIDTILLSFLRDAQEVAVYGVAMKMLEQLAVLPLFFMNSVLPTLTRTIHEKSEKYKAVISYSFDFLTALSIPMVVGGALLAYPIIFIISTPDYLSRLAEGFYGSDIAFQILIFALLFQFVNILFAFILIAINKQYLMLYINAGGVVFNIVTNLILIPRYGFVAAAGTSVASEFIILIGTYFSARHFVKFNLNIVSTLKIIFSSLVMGASIYLLQKPTYALLQNWNIFLLIFLGALIYLAMLFFTRVINKEMLRLFRRPSE